MAAKQGLVVGIVAGVAVAVAAVAASGRLPAFSADGGHFYRTAASSAAMFAPPPGAPMSFADIFDKVSPAVVSIDVVTKIDPQALALQQFGNIFGTPGNGAGRGGGRGGRGGGANGGGANGNGPSLVVPGPGARGGVDPNAGDATDAPRQGGAGSGFLISADGYIVTNNHVVADADPGDITVTLTDGRKLKATVVGTDEYTDLAVIKVSPPAGGRFPFVDFENQAKPRVGDWVITVGNPFKLGGTATAGIVSAFGRNNLGGVDGQPDLTASYVDYIQIDAPINMGNSGGPTFDTFGRVIGVNSAIYSPTGGSVGIGFAIPADIAESIANQLIKNGKVTRGYIGASVQDFTTDMSAALGLGNQAGALVAATVCDGPASKGGLQIQDIVTSVNGVAIKSSSELTREVAKVSPGGAIRLDVIRDGTHRTVTLTSGARPGAVALQAASDGSDCAASPTRISASSPAAAAAAAAPRILGMQLDPNPDGPGLVVSAIRQDSDAYSKGVGHNSVITEVNLRPVKTANDVSAAVAAAKTAGRPSVVFTLDNGAHVTVSIN